MTKTQLSICLNNAEVRITELEKELFKQSQEGKEAVSRAIKIILEKDEKIAELKKELQNAQASKLEAIAKERKRWGREDLNALAIRDLEQQADACDWIYKNVPDLSNRNYMVIQNRARQLRNQANALKEQGE